jgi:hypothetical protein
MIAVFAGALACASAFEDIPADSRVESIDLFKNGLAVVRRTIEVPAPGTYCIANIPEPVHGTFWIESDSEVSARITSRVVEEPVLRHPGAPIQSELAGREVVVFFQDGSIPPASGKVASLEPPSGEGAWNRVYSRPEYYGYYGALYSGGQGQPAAGGYLILESPGGRSYVNTSLIAHVQVKETFETVQRRRPVLMLTVTGEQEKPSAVRITYLSKGMSWAPSYKVDMSGPDELVIRQKAVIKNELEPIAEAEIKLISGFPNIPFAHVTSPLSPRTDWARFFQELGQRFSPGHATTMNVLSQQAVAYNEPPESGLDMQVPAAGEGVDLHFQSIGRHTLDEGDSLAVDVASARAAYERVVEWIVPDNRDANGRYVSDYERERNPEKYQDAAWDSLRFSNPFGFPMTTGPAAIVSGGRFLGQSTSSWISSGEETTLHITKALNIRTRSVEQEEAESEREIVYWGGSKFRKVPVKGFLFAGNHRDESIELVIRRRFSGELLEADRSPRCILLEEGVYSVNKRNELTWNLSIEPGEEVEIVYRYSVLVPH